MPRRTKPEIIVEITGLLRAVDEFPDVTTLAFRAGKRTRAQLQAPLRAYLDATERTREAAVAHQACVAAERRALAQAHPLALRLRNWLRARLDPDSPDLQRYGVKPVKTGKKTVAVKVQAAEKSRETRKLRGTMGRKQRSRIKG
jgi:hypothetical protein